MTIFRGPGGTGSATSDSDTTEFQEFLVQSQAARDAAQAAQAAAEAAEAAAEAAAGDVDAGVAASAASATAAAGSASSAATSATNASSSASSASASASNAASSASSASTSASSASTSATSAGNSATAAASSATAASASASAAASSASTATTQASNAAGSASSASTSASTATTQASNAASSASAASTSATAAATSATNAASSATAAASSATSSSASASEAAATLASTVKLTGDQTIAGVKTLSSNPVLSGGTANGVTYLNGSKVLTSGSALTFDGTNLGVNGGAVNLNFSGTNYASSAIVGLDYYFTTANGASIINNAINSTHVWRGAGSEQMRLTPTGLGIGTSSITDKLTLGSGRIKINTGGLALYMGNDGTDNALQLVSGANIKFQSGSGYATNMLLDSSGNLGLGVTPSAWDTIKPIEIARAGSFVGANSSGSTYLGANTRFSGGSWRYASNGASGLYTVEDNIHFWRTAPSGTAGNAISFTQAMTLDASGNLGVGTTSGSYKVDVSGDVNVTGSYRVNGVVTTGLTGGQTGSAPLYGARAWVNFNGTGTVAIRASGNVSSITDNGTGDYTVNFTTAMPDANYASAMNATRASGGANADLNVSFTYISSTTNAVRIKTGYPDAGTGSGDDSGVTSIAIFR